MKDLNTHIRKNGYDYYKEFSNEDGYIYRQMDGKSFVSYEVFKKMENKRFDCISFPGNEAFGTWAWTYGSIDEAKKRLENFKNNL